MKKASVVVNVNVFLASMFFESKVGDKVLNSIRTRVYDLLSCDEFVHELKRKITHFIEKRTKNEKIYVNFWIDYVVSLAKYIKLRSSIKICRDPKDDYLINLAIDGSAKYLITRDKDLLEIGDTRIAKIVLLPEKFVQGLS